MIQHLQMTVSGKVENTGFRLYALWGANELHINIEGGGKKVISSKRSKVDDNALNEYVD